MIVWSLLRLGLLGALHLWFWGWARVFGLWGLSAERFVADRFGGAGGRMYRSGDLARCGLMGCWSLWGARTSRLRYAVSGLSLGRSQAALLGDGSVSQAAVVARVDGSGGAQLVGYVVAAAGRAVDAPALRAHVGFRGCRITWFRLRLWIWIVYR